MAFVSASVFLRSGRIPKRSHSSRTISSYCTSHVGTARMMTETPPYDDRPNDNGNEDEGTGPEVNTEAEVIDVSAEERPMTTEEAKRELYKLCGIVDRGFTATSSERQEIHATIRQLEQSSTCTTPLDDARLLGKWELIYTNALDIISLTLVTPIASISRIYQNVAADYKVVNVVELEPMIGPVVNLFTKTRTCTRLEVIAKGTRREDDERKLDIQFERAHVRQESVSFLGSLDIPGFTIPFVGGSPVGYIETTFLDEDIRVARAPPTPLVKEDGIFLLRRVSNNDTSSSQA